MVLPSQGGWDQVRMIESLTPQLISSYELQVLVSGQWQTVTGCKHCAFIANLLLESLFFLLLFFTLARALIQLWQALDYCLDLTLCIHIWMKYDISTRML